MAMNPNLTVVRASNPPDGQPFSQKYANQRYIINPGQDTLIPFEAMCLWFGHPDAVDVPGDKRRRFRTMEFQRLCVKYGVYEKHERVEDLFPTIKCHSVLDGEQIITVVDDPEGKHLTPDIQTKAQNADLVQRMEAMAAQMALLQAQITEQNKDKGNHPEIVDELADEEEDGEKAVEIETDTPNRPSTGARPLPPPPVRV